MADEKVLKGVKSFLRSVLISSKNGVAAYNLQSKSEKQTIRIYHDCEVLIENLSRGLQFGIMSLCRVMPYLEPRDRFLDQYLTLMIDSFLAHLWVSTHELNQIYLETFCLCVRHLNFEVIL